MVAPPAGDVDLRLQELVVFAAVDGLRRLSEQRLARPSRKLFHAFIDKQDVLAVVGDEHALVEGLEDALHLLQPFRFLDLHR
jgi:phosphoribosylamine-glycine ligase